MGVVGRCDPTLLHVCEEIVNAIVIAPLGASSGGGRLGAIWAKDFPGWLDTINVVGIHRLIVDWGVLHFRRWCRQDTKVRTI